MSTKVFEVKAADGTWHDYSSLVRARGFGWKRVDYDSTTDRTIDRKLHRVRVAQKRVLNYSLMPDHRGRYAALETDMSQTVVTVRYLDLHGTLTKDFICTSFEAVLDMVSGTMQDWSGGSFSLEEV